MIKKFNSNGNFRPKKVYLDGVCFDSKSESQVYSKLKYEGDYKVVCHNTVTIYRSLTCNLDFYLPELSIWIESKDTVITDKFNRHIAEMVELNQRLLSQLIVVAKPQAILSLNRTALYKKAQSKGLILTTKKQLLTAIKIHA